MSKKKRPYRTREEIIRSHNKSMERLNQKFLKFKIDHVEYAQKRAKLEKRLAKKLGVT